MKELLQAKVSAALGMIRSTLSRSPVLLALVSLPGLASAGGFTPATFADWVRLRAGEAGKPVYWYAEGRVLHDRTGERLANMEGLDVSWVYEDKSRPGTWVQLSRKIFIALDPKTGELLTGPDGKPRRPTYYPFQLRTYRLDGDEIVYNVESHDGARIFAEPEQRNFTVRRLGEVTHFNYAMFIDRVRFDGTRTQRFEVNDFFLRRGARLRDEDRYQYTWTGTGPGPAVSTALSWRYAKFESIPSQRLKDFIRQRAPLWLAPPRDLAEIDTLRQQQPYTLKD